MLRCLAQCPNNSPYYIRISSSRYARGPLLTPGCVIILLTGIEYWQYLEPPAAETTRQCCADGEDPTCSALIPSSGISPPHTVVSLMNYFIVWSNLMIRCSTVELWRVLRSVPRSKILQNESTVLLNLDV
jgi:hypothetical protein